MKNTSESKKRIYFLDEIRGFAVLCMIFYHAFYLLYSFFDLQIAKTLFEFFMPVQPFFAGIFIFICGISCTLSKNNLKRGFILLGVALGMTLVTAVIMPMLGFAECEIYFGILHFLSVSIIIFSLLSKNFGRILPATGIILCAVLYAFTSGAESGFMSYGELISLKLPDFLYETNILMPLGFHNEEFFSSDYFPILPNIFIFFSGVFAGCHCKACGYPEAFYKSRVPALGFLGRNALIIYVAHMPAIYAVAYVIYSLLNI